MKRKISLFSLLIILLGIMTSLFAKGAEINSATSSSTAIPTTISSHRIKEDYTLSNLTLKHYVQLDVAQQKTIADNWHLSIEDYTDYLSLMNNTVNSVYYQDRHLDPSWILGFNAKDDKEREKYVVIAIQNERLRVAKELAFQRDFDRLQHELYPDLVPILWKQD